MIDDDSAEEMVRDNISWMIAVSQKLLGDRALAEDAVQEAFLAAFRGLVKFEIQSENMVTSHYGECLFNEIPPTKETAGTACQ